MPPASLPASLPARLLLWLAWLAVGGFFTWAARRRRPGWARAAAALPLASLNQAAAALAFDGDAELITNVTAFIMTTITNMKLLAWVLDRGALTHPLTHAQWLAVYALPIIPAEGPGGPPAATQESKDAAEQEEREGSQGKRRARHGALPPQPRSALAYFRIFLRKLLALAAAVWAFQRFAAVLPRPLLLAMEGFSQFLGLSLGADAMAAAISATTGLRIAPPFNNPYLSTSLNDFWSRRWNLTVSAVLRDAVYDLIMEGRLMRRPGHTAHFSRTRRLAAVLAVFVCSGLMHEALFWNFSGGVSPGLIWLQYFSLWGTLVVGENVGKHTLSAAGVAVPTVVARLLTLVVVQVMVGYLWWPPLEQLGIPEKATRHTIQTWRAVQKAALGARAA